MFAKIRILRASFVLAASLLAGAAVASAPVAQPQLPPAEALAAIQADPPPQVLDVRTADEYALGHVPGAVLIPHDQLEARLAELDPQRPVLVYCRSGRRSTIAEDLLLAKGFQVRQIDGSWQRWQEERLPVEVPVAAQPQPVPSASALAEEAE